MIKEINGDLILMAKNNNFDVITHGCNCFCSMKSGIAPLLADAFGCDKFPMEYNQHKGLINKLGTIDYKLISNSDYQFFMVNSYTQYYNQTLNPNPENKLLLDYDALRLCLRKINFQFKGLRIGLPKIGAGRAGGDYEKIKQIIIEELVDMDITIVIKE